MSEEAEGALATVADDGSTDERGGSDGEDITTDERVRKAEMSVCWFVVRIERSLSRRVLKSAFMKCLYLAVMHFE